MAVSTGAIVANNYYIQPLLAQIARDFHLTVTEAGHLAMLGQIGTALGMFIFVPLGDLLERRGLITWMVLACVVNLALFAMATNAVWLGAASFLLGATCSAVHVIVPLSAHLAPAHQRGRVVGTVLSGLLIGILLARTVSGLLGAQFGWRAVYWAGAGAMLALALLIRLRLPYSHPQSDLSWAQLVRSLGTLVSEQPVLREAAFTSATLFCAFSAFWTTLVFFLETPPYHYGPSVAGLFGLVGAVGAMAAPVMGHLADRFGARTNVLIALLVTAASFLWMGWLGTALAGLVLGVVLLDVGVQAGHVSNQTRIYALVPEARGRLNTVYMVCYFTGGALGSWGGSWAWGAFGWLGVCGFSMAVLGLGLVGHVFIARGAKDNGQTRAQTAGIAAADAGQ